ncbi:protein SCAR2-like isoform X2 [Macadamia integrifolia]|uniref:protein SCAR2-like isoform X2 n=1 Tax=Macadamia integrifolia TaxID=60698 RepID=UPI001C4E9A5C|nr:protein SCAR2-like isoform X2 [Macadamia integrifolia]
MPLTRFQTRNEYSLADPELYRAAGKDDPEALLEGVAMAGLVGVLRQLGDLAEFAAEIFHDLHEEVMATAARGHGLMLRVQQLEAEVPSIERAFLSRTSHSLFLFNAGVGWHPNLRTDQNVITRGDLPRCVMDSYEECRGPPRLFLLDKFDVAGAGACLKRYSDPSFFKAEFTSSETMEPNVHREKKPRKVKKKGSRWRNGENPEDFPTSHAKLHQLLSKERHSENDVLVDHVKLKKRQLNGFPLKSTTGKSYMERFLEAHSPESKESYEKSLVVPHLNMESSNASELGLEIREIGTASPANKLLQGERRQDLSAERQKIVLEQSMYDLHDDVIKKSISEKLPEPICDIKVEKVPSSLHKLEDQKELLVDVESNKEDTVDGYQSDDMPSEVENYMDALATMESEMETDTETRPKYERGFFKSKRLGSDSNANERQKHEAHFSESPSVGNSSESDDENNFFKGGISNPSKIDTLSNLAVKGPPGGDAVAKVATSTEAFPAEVVDVSSENPSANGSVSIPESLEFIVPNGFCNEVSVIPSYGSELVEASPNSCVEDSTSTASRSNPGANLNEFQLQGQDFVGYPSAYMRFSTEARSPNTEVDIENIGGIPSTTNLSDSASKMKDDPLAVEFLECQQVQVIGGLNHYELSSYALMHQSDISGLTAEGKYSGDTLEAVPPTECAELNTKQPECLSTITSPDDLDDLKSDRTLESDIGIQTTGENPEYLTSALDIQKTGVSAKQGLSEMMEEVPPPQPDLGVGSGSSGAKMLDNNLGVSSNKSARGVNDEPALDVVQLNSYGSVGKVAAASLEFSSTYSAPDSPKPALMTDHRSQMDSLTGTVCAEADVDGILCWKPTGSSNHMILEEECPSSTRGWGGLVSGVHSQLDDVETGSIHAEAGGETSVCRRLGSPSRNHVKLEDKCHSSNGNESHMESEIHSKLDNMVSGAAHTGDADSLNIIGSPSRIQIKLQEECLKAAEKERNQLPASSSDLNVEVYNSESHMPSSSELPYDLHDAMPVKCDQALHLRDITGTLTSSMETDKILQFAHRNLTSKRAEDPGFTSLSHKDLIIPSEEALVLEGPLLSNLQDEQAESLEGKDQNGCPGVPSVTFQVEKIEPVKHTGLDGSSGAPKSASLLPPLPPQGWRVGTLLHSSPTSEGEMVQPSLNPFLPLPMTEDEKHEHDSITLGEEKSQPSLNSFVPPSATKEVRPASDTSQGESDDLQKLTELKLNIKDGMLQPPIIKDEEPVNSFAPSTVKDEQPMNDAFASPTIKDEEALNAFASPTIKGEEPSRSSLTLEGEMPSNASTSLPDAEVRVPNGKPPRKIPRPRDPLIEAVASHDRSTLKKVTQQARPQIAQKMDERDSLLEQIRTKSFNLKPTTGRSMLTTRSIIQGPRTNLKVAAILEKANAIRQATAGSDEDDDDDSWSDS